MKKNSLLLSSVLTLLILIIACKKKTDTDACALKTCQPNAICNEGKCECPIGTTYRVKDQCILKDNKTFYYIGKNYNCIPDTFSLKITQDANNSNAAHFNYVIPFGKVAGGGGVDGQYFPLSDGDSIRTVGIFDKCNVNGVNCTTEILGKFKSKDQLELTIRFFELSNYSKTLDQFKLTMKK